MQLFSRKDFLPYMPDICKYNAALIALNEKWENIKLLCEINCPKQSQNILPQMSKIQTNFASLQHELIDALIDEEISKINQKIIPKAKAALDILIRSLYERTADASYLAKDSYIRRFTSSCGQDANACSKVVLKRLHEYVSKYSVYNDAIILDKNSKVLINLDSCNDITGKTVDDPLVRETLESDSEFVETFRKSPLQKKFRRAHIFSSKITDENSGETIGVLCLCFSFEKETETIFRKMANPDEGLVVSIIDHNDNVIASNDENYMPAGTHLETDESTEEHIVCYRGLEYIVKTLRAVAYQGYKGLGWRAHIMVPLNIAFKEKTDAGLCKIDSDIKSGLMNKADSYSEKLKNIITQTEKINRSLKSIVFNGQLITNENSRDSEFTPLRPLLHYMNRMGSEISRVFEDSVRNLFSTVVSSSLNDSVSLSSFCINIMDRNLYERADDCRWWALDPAFRKILSKSEITDGDKKILTDKLSYINSLYTVYSSLFIFGKDGRVIAVSDNGNKDAVGSEIDKPFIKDILANCDESKYFVSPFEKTSLYGGQYTYIYGASITDAEMPSETIGGIGIVFDSTFQFRSMLEASLPETAGSFCVFTDRGANVISSTRDDISAGAKLEIPDHFLKIGNGMTVSEIMVYENKYYAVGCTCSSSYREYKNTDGYKNDVLAFVFKMLADYDGDISGSNYDMLVTQSDIQLSENEEHVKLVSFVTSGKLVAIKEDDVVESIDSGAIINIPESNELIRGAVVYKTKYVPVINTHVFFGGNSETDISPHLLIVRLTDDMLIAMEADQLNNVLELNKSDIKLIPDMGAKKSIIKGVVYFENSGGQLMLVIDYSMIPERMDKDLLKADFDNVLPFIEKVQKKST